MDNFAFDKDGNIVPTDIELPDKEWEPEAGKLSSIFEIQGQSYDVDLDNEKISWTSMSGTGKGVKLKRSRSSSLIRRLSRGFSTENLAISSTEKDSCIYLKNIIGVKIKRLRRATQQEGEGVCLGIAVIFCETKDANRLRNRLLCFGNPSEDICSKWFKKIRRVLATFTGRPKNVRIFLQPHAGSGGGKALYKEKIRPIFDAAGVKHDVTEVVHNEHIKLEMIHIELDWYDSIVCIGGDGTVNKVVNGLLTKVHKSEDVVPTPHFTPIKPPIPVGIIPTGTVNSIVHSIQGTEDIVTATLHIVLGNTCPVNMCSVWEQDKLLQWAFNCHYGFFGTMMNIVSSYNKYNVLGEKRLELAGMKIMSTKKLRPYGCDVQFSPLANVGTAKDGLGCAQGCEKCDPNKLDASSTYSDEVQDIDPLNHSSTSSTIIDLSKEMPRLTHKGSFLSVSLHSLPARCSLTPAGLSKYTHLNDGYMDLILIGEAEKKEFARYLRRLGNNKDQLDFPFIESHRCKEVKFKFRSRETWNYKDHDYSEVDYEVERQNKSSGKIEKSKSMTVIDDLKEDSEEEKDDDDDDESDDDDDSTLPDNKSVENSDGKRKKSRAKSLLQSAKQDIFTVTPSNDKSVQVGASPSHHAAQRKSLSELEQQRRKKQTRKRDEKKKNKAEGRMKSVWNVDNEALTQLDLEFRAHPSVVHIHGLGVSLETEPNAVKLSCLTMF